MTDHKHPRTPRDDEPLDVSPASAAGGDFEVYSDRGISFHHGRGWSVASEDKPGERVVSVTGATSGFWSLMIFLDRPDPEDVLETVLASFRDEYDDLDEYDAEAEICGQPALARDLGFFCYDLTNTAEIRVFQTDRLTVLVLCQATDDDWDEVADQLHQMTATLELDETLLAENSFTVGDFDDLTANDESGDDSADDD